MQMYADFSHADLDKELARLASEQSRQLRKDGLLLYAGASLLNEGKYSLLSPDLSAMPAMGPPYNKEQPGSEIVSRLEVLVSTLACEVFGAAWADVRLPSCTVANLAVYSFLRSKGTLMLAPAGYDGGHLSQRQGGTPSVCGYEIQNLPFDSDAQCLDTLLGAQIIETTSPSIVMLGRSVILGPEDLRPVCEAARKVGATTIYDASHVAGLIAGGAFPNPFDMGVDLITTSTYKTLCGPTGSLVMGQDPSQGETFSRFLDTAFLANQDASRFPILGSALNAYRSGTDYARRVVDAAQCLKDAFKYHDIPVLAPDQKAGSHQVVVPVGSFEKTANAIRSLEAAGILVGHCPVPGIPGNFGLRFGTQVAVARGLSKEIWADVASCIANVLRVCHQMDSVLTTHHSEVSEALKTVTALVPEGSDSL